LSNTRIQVDTAEEGVFIYCGDWETMHNIRAFKDTVAAEEIATSPRIPDPTPSEIRQLTAEIQSGWSDRERSKRETGNRRIDWNVPRVGLCTSPKSVE